jgi:hypothetical protein
MKESEISALYAAALDWATSLRKTVSLASVG